MSKTVELTDEQYATLEAAAARGAETPQQLLERMLRALAATQGPIYYTDDELLRALGADDAELAELAKLEWQADADQ
jgi:hypothetical protein